MTKQSIITLAALFALTTNSFVAFTTPVPTRAHSTEVRINTGGPAQTVSGVSWVGCNSASNCFNYVTNGFAYTKTPLAPVSPLVAPANEAVYQSEWTGGSTTGIPVGGVAFSFNVPVENGDYLIRLHFAEVVQTAAGARKFDVKIEGDNVLTNFDVFQEAGGQNKGIVREFTKNITDGVVSIDFIRQVQNAKISGIEILNAHEEEEPEPTVQNALFVVGNTTLSSADSLVNARLQNLGFQVELIKDSSVTAANATGKQLVVISATVYSGNVYNKLTNVAVPLISWEPYLMDDLKLTNSTNFGRVESQTQLTITSGSHPMKAGLSGNVNTNSSATEFAWGLPSTAAVTIAHAINTPSKPVIFGYIKDSQMVGITAPANRVGFFLGDSTANSLTSAGWQLFDAAINWVAQVSTTTPPSTTIIWNNKSTDPIYRFESVGTAVNGKIYVMGGYSGFPAATKRVDMYDPTTNTWTRKADMPEAYTHSQAVVDGNTIYLVGGFTGDYPSPSTGRVWKYDTVSNTWSAGPDLPENLGGGGAAIVGRNLHYFGGTIRQATTPTFTDKTSHYMLDLDEGTTWQTKASLPTKRNHLAGISLDGKVYALGGQLTGNEGGANQAVVEMYDPATNIWTPKAPMPTPKGHIAASTFVKDGYIYVIGGSVNDGAGGTATAEVARYNPSNNTWTTMSPLPAGRKAPVANTVNDKLYVIGGFFTGGTNNVWEGVMN